MAEIINTYRQSAGASRFIGKKYGDEDRVNGGFSEQWCQWFADGLFEIVEKQKEGNVGEVCEDDGAYIGLMRWKCGEPFEYWIGIFMPENTTIPDGFDFIDFPKKELGVCWVYGKDNEVYMQEENCAAKLKEEGFELAVDEKGARWFFERYGCPRFTTPDEKGNVILDICHHIK